MIKVVVKSFSELRTQELYEILKLRFSIFVMEQRCFYLDPDGIDYDSIHVFLVEKSAIIGYARLFPEEETGIWHVGRVLTTLHGKGIGRKLMEAVISEAERRDAKLLRMESQLQAQGFYEKSGFSVCSDIFEEAGIPHVKMEKLLSR